MDVLTPRAVEAATEQEPRVVVDENNPGFMDRAKLFGGLHSAGIGGSPLDRLAQHLFVAWLDVPYDGKFCPRPRLQSRPLLILHRSEERRVGEEGRSRWSPYH